MTLPIGGGGVTPGNWWLFGQAGSSDTGGIADLPNRLEDIVKEFLSGQVDTSQLQNVFSGVWDGLRQGISLPLAVAEAIVNKLFGTSINFQDMGTLINAIEQVPGVSQLMGLIQQISGVNLLTVFNGIDLSDPGAVLTAIESAVAGVVQGIIQNIIDTVTGTLTGSSAIGNDITAIASALFQPLVFAQNLAAQLGTLAQQFAGTSAANTGQIAVLQANVAALQTAATVTPAAGHDDCTTVANFTNVLNTLAAVTGSIQTSGWAAGVYNLSPATDKHGVKMRVNQKMGGGSRVSLCGDAGFTNYAALEVYASGYGSDYVRIVTGSTPTNCVAQVQYPIPGSGADYHFINGDVFECRYDPATNTFYVFKNGEAAPILTWTDTGNLVSHGAGKRRVGAMTNIENIPYPLGPGIDDFYFYDW